MGLYPEHLLKVRNNKLPEFVNFRYKTYLQVAGIAIQGMPVLSRPGEDTVCSEPVLSVVWVGTRPTRRGLLPALAVTLDSPEARPEVWGNWHSGAIETVRFEAALTAAPGATMPDPALAVLQAAVYNHRDVKSALDSLQLIVPRVTYPVYNF